MYKTNKPEGAITCRILEENEIASAIQQKRPYADYLLTSNYFLITSRPDSFTVEGYLGRSDHTDIFFKAFQSNYTFFSGYKERRTIYMTFDQSVLYRISSILPGDPLLFILKQINNLPNYTGMVNTEQIYQLLFREEWSSLLHLLHNNRLQIVSESTLSYAAKKFEEVFFERLDSYPLNDTKTNDALDLLYVLHSGNYYKLHETNAQRLIVALVMRKPLPEAYRYALQFPDLTPCARIISEYENTHPANTTTDQSGKDLDWPGIYTRLFELMDDKKDSSTYFSGPRFLTTVRSLLTYFPEYEHYLAFRNAQGKSTSRKIFFYDILFEQQNPVRILLVQAFLKVLSPFKPVECEIISQLLLGKRVGEASTIGPVDRKTEETPVVFISYSWDNEAHKEWVLHLAERLIKKGVEVILDRYELRAGKSITRFIDNAIARANRIIIVFTPNYKLRAEGRDGGVGYEYSIVNQTLYENQKDSEKLIPILKNGSREESIPVFMRQFVHLDMSNDTNFENSYTDLLREIYNEPEVVKPMLGENA